MRKMLVLAMLLCLGCACWSRKKEIRPEKTDISIVSWNMQAFGEKKIKNKSFMDFAKKLFDKYDISIILEYRRKKPPKDLPFKGKVIYSKRLGRTRMKEQYVVFYNPKYLKLLYSYTYPDPRDRFHREPFICYFKSIMGFDFVLVIIHTDPDEITSEIPELFNAVRKGMEEISNKFCVSEYDIIVVGDFNEVPYKIRQALIKEFGFYLVHQLGIRFAISKPTTKGGKKYDNFIFGKYTNEFLSSGVEEMPDGYSDHFPIYARFKAVGDDD